MTTTMRRTESSGRRGPGRWAGLMLGAATLAVGITFGVHFPLHDTLGATGATGAADTVADIAAVRDGFEAPWVNAHLVRTAAVILALVALCRALWLGRGTAVAPRHTAETDRAGHTILSDEQTIWD